MDLLKKLFTKRNLTYETLLNKAEFLQVMKDKGLSDEQLEEQWEKIEHVFSMYLYQELYNNLEESKKTELSYDTKSNIETPEDMEKLAYKINKIVQQNLKLINIEKALSNAVQLTQEKYISLFNEK